MYQIIVRPLEFFYGIWPNYAGAIALLTLTIMIVLLPLTLKGTRSMLAMQKLQPELKKLQNKYRDDRQKLNEEMMRFYKENNINPMAGCFPLLLQMPVFFVLYRTIYDLINRSSFGHDLGASAAQYVKTGGAYEHFGNFDAKHLDHGSRLWQDLHQTNEMHSFGMNLAESATKAWGQGLGHALPYVVLVIIVAGTSYYQQRQIAGRTDQSSVNPQQQMLMKIMPLFFSVISLTLPAGIVVYFLVSNLFRIGQQAFITKTMYKDKEGNLIHATARDADDDAPPPKGFREQLREARNAGQAPAKGAKNAKGAKGSGRSGGKGTTTKAAKGGAGSGSKAGSGKAASGGQQRSQKAGGAGGSGAKPANKPSRSAPSGANRSKNKKKRR